MRFLIINTDYPEFLYWLYAQHPGLENQPYEEQMRIRMETLFGVADFYSSNLRKLGHEAWDIHANNEFMQKAWAKEHGVFVDEPASLKQCPKAFLQWARLRAAATPLHYLKLFFRPIFFLHNKQPGWFYEILASQVKYYKPDVLINQAMDSICSRFMWEIKPYTRLLVGQIASPLPKGEDYTCYDLIISSLGNIVDYFKRQGISSERHLFGFEPKILDTLDKSKDKIIAVSFVGGLSSAHRERVQMLEDLCRWFDLQIWGVGVNGLSKNSIIHRHYKGQAWGHNMYQILAHSKVTINRHGKWAGPYANNMRLFEATGVGTLLITDWRENLRDMFEPGKEVVTYRSVKECAELIQYYLEHDNEREAIAKAGQQRTLREHTYYHRMQELVDIVRKYL